MVQHIDEHAVSALGKYYAGVLPRGGRVLDLMSSWTSHLAEGTGRDRTDGYFEYVSAIGMHEAELQQNPALHDYHAHDLNKMPLLPMYADASFDAVFCSVSVDYLARPLEVFAEIHRILKPGGIAVFTWSNRMFPTKAISAWREASEPGRLWICGAYFHYAKGDFSPPKGLDLSPHAGRSDPLYAVTAKKLPLENVAKAEL
jgi:SAM-dependent methyltransferase